MRNSAAPLPRLAYTADEVAEMLGAGRSTVYEWVRLGRLDTIRIGGLVRIPAAALDDFIEHHRIKAASRG